MYIKDRRERKKNACLTIFSTCLFRYTCTHIVMNKVEGIKEEGKKDACMLSYVTKMHAMHVAMQCMRARDRMYTTYCSEVWFRMYVTR